MQTVYFVYSDVWSYEAWHLNGLFTDKKMAYDYMLECAQQDFEEHEAYVLGEGKAPPSFEEYLEKEYKLVSKLVIETAEDKAELTCKCYIVYLATGEIEQTRQSLDFKITETPKMIAKPHFMGSRKIAIEDNTLDCVWTCGNTEEHALKKLKGWLLLQLRNYPKHAVYPHESLLK